MRLSRITLAALSLAGASFSHTALANPIAGWSQLWTYQHQNPSTGVTGQSGEIPAFDAATNTLWVVGPKGVAVLDARLGSFVQHISFSALWLPSLWPTAATSWPTARCSSSTPPRA